MKTKIQVLLQFLLISLACVEGIMDEAQASPKEIEVQEVKHRSAIKTIKTEDGDIFDCVDVYSQPAFDHPLLKRHRIQIRPTSFPGGTMKQYANAQSVTNSIGCPSGTIPCRRHDEYNKIQDITHTDMLKSMTRNISTERQERRTLYADYITDGMLKGSKASVTVYEPEVKEGNERRHSGAFLFIKAAKQLVAAGWFVDQGTYGDRHARLSISWRDDTQNKECVDLFCPGFVQVSSHVALGMRLSPVSTYNGKQYSITITIFQDSKTENWWLAIGEDKKLIGYWPKSLLPGLSSNQRLACWGGTTYSPPGELAPSMGSGHFPSEGYGKSAFFNNILIMDKNNNFVIPNPRYFSSDLDKSKCYQLGGLMVEKTSLGFYFGGPGGC